MPNGCVLVKLPVVIADIPGSITVDNVTCLDEQAKKVDHIDVVVRDLEADPVFTGPVFGNRQQPCTSPKATVHFGDPVCGPREIRSINVHGELHKQIYYVNRDDDVRHMAEDIPFSKNIKLDPPLLVDNPNNIDIDFRDVDVNVDFELPRSTRIQQIADISFVLKVTEDQQLFIQLCIPTGELPGQQVLQNTGFEAFAGCVLSVWQQSNVAPGQPGRNNGFSVGLAGPAANGECTADPQEVASLVQQIDPTVLRPGLSYRFCFWAQEVVQTGPGSVTDYTLEARVVFRDATGSPINSAATVTRDEAALNGNWQEVCVTSNVVPANAVSGTVEIVFTPVGTNNAFVRIDDATLTVL